MFVPEQGPCYRCLYPEPPPPALVALLQEAGVLGVLPGVIGVLQATEAIKLLLGIGEPLIGRLLTYDALGMRFRELKLRRDPKCPVCGEHPSMTRRPTSCPASRSWRAISQATTPPMHIPTRW